MKQPKEKKSEEKASKEKKPKDVFERAFKFLIILAIVVAVVVLCGTAVTYILNINWNKEYIKTAGSNMQLNTQESIIGEPNVPITENPDAQSPDGVTQPAVSSDTGAQTDGNIVSEVSRLQLEYLEKIYLLNKETSNNGLLSFIYAFLSSVLIGISTYFAKRTTDNFKKVKKRVEGLDKKLVPIRKDVGAAKKGIAALGGKLASAREETGSVKKDIAALDEKLASAREEISGISNSSKAQTCTSLSLQLLMHVSTAHSICLLGSQASASISKASKTQDTAPIQDITPRINDALLNIDEYTRNNRVVDEGSILAFIFNEVIHELLGITEIDPEFNSAGYIAKVESFYDRIEGLG